MKQMQRMLYTFVSIVHVNLPVTVLLRALGFGSDQEIIDINW